MRDEPFTPGRLARETLRASTEDVAAALNGKLGVDPREAGAELHGEIKKVQTEIAEQLEYRGRWAREWKPIRARR